MKKKLFAALLFLLLLAYGGWRWMLRSDWLREKVRERAVAELEKATGGKASIGKVDFDPELMNARVDAVTLRGSEGAGEPPLFHAERVEAAFHIRSFTSKDIDLKKLVIVRPQIHVSVDAQGRTNLPSPRVRRGTRNPMEDFLALTVEEYSIVEGVFSYSNTRTPFHASGKNLNAHFNDHRGTVGSSALLLKIPGIPELPVDLQAKLELRKDLVVVESFRARSGATIAEGKGQFWENGELELSVASDISEVRRLFGIDAGRGPLRSNGTLRWTGGAEAVYDGEFDAKGQAAATGHLRADKQGLVVDRLAVRAGPGVFKGRAELAAYTRYIVDGVLDGVSLASLRKEPLGYSAAVSGPVRVEGERNGPFVLKGQLNLSPLPGAAPLEGLLNVSYSSNGLAAFANSDLRSGTTRVDFSGTMNQTLRVKAVSESLADIAPALKLAGLDAALPEASIAFEGTVSGTPAEPLVAGQVRASGVRYGKFRLDSATATVVASPSKLTLTRFAISREGASASGAATMALEKWRAGEQSALDARFEGRAWNAASLREQLGFAEPVEGLVNVTADVRGTIGKPDGDVELDWFRPAWKTERLDRLRATLSRNADGITVRSFEATQGPAKLSGDGSYRGEEVDVNFTLAALDLAALPRVQAVRKGTAGTVSATGRLRGLLRNGDFQLRAADAKGRLAGLSIDGQPYGELDLTAVTSGGEIRADLQGRLAGAPVTGTSAWKTSDGYPGSARLEFGRVPFRVFETLRPTRVVAEEWPFIGAFQGTVDFRGPLLELDRWRVAVALTGLNAKMERKQGIGSGFELRNDGPVVFSAEGRTIQIRAAKFVGQDTNLSVNGTFSLAEKRPWDLRVNGNVNLAGLRAFSPDVVATGVATIQANVRGELANPQVFGGLELKNATLNMDGVPNGLDRVTGRVLFDRRRATIQDRLTAQSGGGGLSLGGFIDFAGAETFYRLQAQANRVRIRYPEGVSTVADANLSLAGSTERSLVSGTVTVLRSGFTPRTDLGSLLAESSQLQSAPKEPNKFLANMQVDVKVRTAAETQFSTSLTSDLQAEANLQVRGTGARPVALGRISVSQGDINFFGNRYSIKRGDVAFYNPTKIEPTLDMDLETRVRGVNVVVNFTGPVDKLNVSYRSDPPLQPSEIIALLTVGRSPTSATVGSSQSGARGTFLESGANSLLGSAISAPISSQLQRFFGVSRIKIDPTISGLDSTPQARVTVEQQVSKDITMTFVTNLNRSQQQVVRLEWNMSREWSLIALRDENGSFGLDFQVRKQVK
ncbi:MAG: hypothetical protein FJW30_01425 [Acidobacteria bacterium]|nr:hypothetical protein [Acidobacteriota bacterium]